MPKREARAAPMASLQPHAEEYAVFLNRFKLLNLVQRVAHNDVMELVETVGLNALTYKGVRLPGSGGTDEAKGILSEVGDAEDWGGTKKGRAGGRSRRGEDRFARLATSTRRAQVLSSERRRRSSPAASGGYQPRRTNQNLRAAAAVHALRDDRSDGAEDSLDDRRARRSTRPRWGDGRAAGHRFRTRAERVAYYERLAAPRQRLDLDQELPPSAGEAEGMPPPAASRGRAAPEEEEERRLFAAFLRSRYGEGGALPPPLPPAAPQGREAIGGLSDEGPTPPWRRLQPYGQGSAPTGPGLDPSRSVQAHPPSSTWPPHAAGGEDPLAFFYRGQQPMRGADDGGDRDGPPPSDSPRTAPRCGDERGLHGDGQSSLPQPQFSATAMDTSGDKGGSAATTLATTTHFSPAFNRDSPPPDRERPSHDLGGEKSPPPSSGFADGHDAHSPVSPQDRGDSFSAMLAGGLLQGPSVTTAAGVAATGGHGGPLAQQPVTPRERVPSAPSPTSETLSGRGQSAFASNLSSRSQGQLTPGAAAGGREVSRVLGGGRSLAAKPKPKGALDPPSVPMDVIRRAASVLSRQQSAGGGSQPSLPAFPVYSPRDMEGSHASQPLPSPTNRSRSVVFAATAGEAVRQHSAWAAAGDEGGTARTGPAVMRQGRGWSNSPPQQQQQPSQGTSTLQHEFDDELPPPVHRAPPPSLVAIAESIEKMLRDHRRILSEVVRETPQQKTKAGATDSADKPSQSSEETTHGEGEEHGEGSSGSGSVDEMVVFARLQRKADAIDRDMARIQSVTALAAARARGHQMSSTTSSQEYADSDGSVRNPAGPNRATPEPATVATAPRKPQRRERGAVPEAVVRRLLSYQVEQAECAAYNEKLWNTSTVSQFAFAQRLTNTLFEDCLDEVTQEVAGIMDEYVDGLADHELQ